MSVRLDDSSSTLFAPSTASIMAQLANGTNGAENGTNTASLAMPTKSTTSSNENGNELGNEETNENDITVNGTSLNDLLQTTTTSSSPAPDDANLLAAFDMEAQQKALQRLTSSLGLGNFRTPFNVNVIPPFLAALQQNPLSLQQQLLNFATGAGLSGISPGPDDDCEDGEGQTGSVEPEDLTLGSIRRTASRSDDLGGHDGNGTNGAGSNGGPPTWSYEEQFKQLYELSDDVKRKEWLDDWLSFMHRIGKPVTRIPIMAKQVLDLYELYRLVVQHGGLVEIINKKLWREITKGLNLPSSITSAAFTLRTQYQKYLYDYECEKEGLSNPADLQAAIDGNRREAPGRRNPGPSGPQAAFPLGFPLPHPGGANLLEFLDEDGNLALQQNNLLAAYRAEQMAIFEAQHRLERAQRAAADLVARQTLGLQSGRESTSSIGSEPPAAKKAKIETADSNGNTTSAAMHNANSGNRHGSEKANQGHMKISAKKADGSTDENCSMMVSMEINGVTYQGVLFALDQNKPQPPAAAIATAIATGSPEGQGKDDVKPASNE
ncbi:hypothetical protein WR25_04704 [Diploscapter pachys]|uniref:ARID domain-containing protein n=1 Tax=Diploscapter pachys TaxID=2018661 RepID=A0A2A2KYH6_9BILA|nr:hypothetical protein WR25_04704 [Diploscapter pachys]